MAHPLYFVPGTGQFETVSGGTSPSFAIGAFVVWTIGLSILFTWLFNETRGSLIVVILFHTSINLAAFVPRAVRSTGAASFLYAIITWIVALVIVARFWAGKLVERPCSDDSGTPYLVLADVGPTAAWHQQPLLNVRSNGSLGTVGMAEVNLALPLIRFTHPA